jgi:hypothetical protein
LTRLLRLITSVRPPLVTALSARVAVPAVRLGAHALLLAIAAWLLLGAAGPASAASQVKFRWDSCWGDGGVMNRDFACNVNTGSDRLIASFVPNRSHTGITMLESRIDITVAGGSVPDWWRFKNAGSCRLTSLTASAAIPPSASACVDWAGGSALDAIVTYVTFDAPVARASVTVTSQVPDALAADMPANQEYFAFALNLNHQKSVGTGACAGCTLPACLGLQYVEQSTPTGIADIYDAFSLDSDWLANWQGGGVLGCQFTSPVRSSTWGGVKALYH